MIKFLRDGNKVQIVVEHGIFYNDSYFTLEINQSQDYQAELLKRAFQGNLNKHLTGLKEKYYNEGWKHAKAKKAAKRTSFWGGWEKK